jgi:arylsulfatase A-like enzyme
VAYSSLIRWFHFSLTLPKDSDAELVEKAIQLIENEDPAFFRIHLQTPGNEGRYLSYTTPEKPWFRNIWGPGSPYVQAIEQADVLLGRLIESLKKSGKWDETLLVVSSDQGQSRIGWHPVADEDSWTCPLLLTGPKIPKTKKVNNA